MRKILTMMTIGLAALLSGCNNPAKEADFKYTIDAFADLKVMRYQIPGWENLTLQQKEYAYWLSEAAKYGRDILWDQNCKENLRVRHALEAILEADGIDTLAPEYADFLVYAKRVFFSNGIHHHYAEDKIFPACPRDYFAGLLVAAGVYGFLAAEDGWQLPVLALGAGILLCALTLTPLLPRVNDLSGYRHLSEDVRDAGGPVCDVYTLGVYRPEAMDVYLHQDVQVLDPEAFLADPSVVPEGAVVVVSQKKDAAASYRYSDVLRNTGRHSTESSMGLYRIWR